MHICIVDDNPLVARQLRQFLREEGATLVEQFTEPRAALERCRREPPDLILLDYNMPDVDGLKFIGRLRSSEVGESIPVVMLTGWALQGLTDRARQMGVLEVVDKPIHASSSLAKLHAALTKVRASKAGLAPERQRPADRERPRDETTSTHSRQVELVISVAQQLAKSRGMNASYGDMLATAITLRNIDDLWPDIETGTSPTDALGFGIGESPIGDGSMTMSIAMEVAQSRHEHWDGSGYPGKLSGHRIPIAARIVAVAESLASVLISMQPGADPEIVVNWALDVLQQQSGQTFDPELVGLAQDLRDLWVQLLQPPGAPHPRHQRMWLHP